MELRCTLLGQHSPLQQEKWPLPLRGNLRCQQMRDDVELSNDHGKVQRCTLYSQPVENSDLERRRCIRLARQSLPMEQERRSCYSLRAQPGRVGSLERGFSMEFPCLAQEELVSRASGSHRGVNYCGKTGGYRSWEEAMGCGAERRGSRCDSW